MIDYKGLRDCHLNIFWQYDGKPYLENNITKAFINSIDSLSDVKKKHLEIKMLLVISNTVPKEFFKINTVVLNLNALCFEQLGLLVYSAERERLGKFPETVHHAITAYILGVGVDVERVPHNPCPARISRQHSNLTVCRDFPERDFFHNLVNLVKTCHKR